MATLSSGTWIGVGVFVFIISILVREIRVFAVVGALFILFGFVKLLIARLRQPRKAQPEHTYHTQQPDYAGGKKRCFVCGAMNSEAANFCGHCGHRLT